MEKLRTKDEDAIRSILEEVVASFENQDLEKLLSLHSKDIIVMEPDRPAIVGMEEVTNVFTAAFNGLKQRNKVFQLSFEILELEVWGARAFVRGQVIKKTVNQNGDSIEEAGKFLSIFKKQPEGRWLRSHVMANFDGPVNNREEIWND